ncbi:MAG: SUF system NifU family Fe-S cluster assembly protein [Candidatus Sericytochromatia bacterium]|nr:SUF system NifU family Fe-S cluster assembly protein [Candidatus Sericytochromatia bacterium]
MDTRAALYNQLILEHNKKPRNYGKLETPTHQSEGLNPLCGDHIWLTAEVAEGVVARIGFEGQSCAICQASASIMTTQVKGKPLADVEGLIHDFRHVVTGQPDAVSPENRDNRYFGAFAGIATLPARVKCAVLPWHTLHAALHGEAASSTEGSADPIPGSGLAQSSPGTSPP